MKKTLVLCLIVALTHSIICQFRGRGGGRGGGIRTSRQAFRPSGQRRTSRTFRQPYSRPQIRTPQTFTAPAVQPQRISPRQQYIQRPRAQTSQAPLVIRGGVGRSHPRTRSSQRTTARIPTYTKSLSRFRQPYRRDNWYGKWRRRPRWRPYYSAGYYPIYGTSYVDTSYYPSSGIYSPFTDATNIVNPEVLGINPNEYPYYTDIPEKVAPYPSGIETEGPLIIRGQTAPSSQVAEAPDFTTTLIDVQPQQQEIAQEVEEQGDDTVSLLEALLEEELKNVHED